MRGRETCEHRPGCLVIQIGVVVVLLRGGNSVPRQAPLQKASLPSNMTHGSANHAPTVGARHNFRVTAAKRCEVVIMKARLPRFQG